MAEANLDAYLTVTMINPTTRIQVLKKDYSNQYQPFLVDVVVRLCEVIEKRNFIPYAVMTWKLLKRFSNINHTCPYSGQLIVRNSYMPADLVPQFPHGFYQFRFTYSDSNATNSEYLP
ncbi:uncharacterized protein [Drosophila takahashii]|uniref:uncharacterized protein n=1 Tax=Drosophila takahashii TaxID=29030 RepID=UPI003898DC7D